MSRAPPHKYHRRYLEDRVKLCLDSWGEAMRMPDGEFYCTLLKPYEGGGECPYLNTDKMYELSSVHRFYGCEKLEKDWRGKENDN